jgi:hypothetical protein
MIGKSGLTGAIVPNCLADHPGLAHPTQVPDRSEQPRLIARAVRLAKNMILVLVLTLGLVLSVSPMLGPPSSPLDPESPVVLLDWDALVQLHSPINDTLPCCSSREELTAADSEEDDESAGIGSWFASSIHEPLAKRRRPDHRVTVDPGPDGRLRQLHRSWQLLC